MFEVFGGICFCRLWDCVDDYGVVLGVYACLVVAACGVWYGWTQDGLCLK
jgi:hypothetical protein